MPPSDLNDELKKLSSLLQQTGDEDSVVYTLPDFLDSFGITFPDTPKNFGIPENLPLSAAEVESIRVLADNGDLPEVIAFDFNVSEEVINDILDGKIGPYAGGVIRQPKARSGCNPRLYRKNINDQMFVAGVLALAKDMLTRQQYEVFVAFNGLDPKSISKLEKRQNNERDPASFQRYRDFIREHSQQPQKERPRVRRNYRGANS